MSTLERERERLEHDEDVPRMRHIAEAEAMQRRPIIAMCGYALPIIEGFDVEADRGPCATAECIVCIELARAKGYL